MQPPQLWVAVIRYRYTGEPMRMEDRLINPLGFEVLRYRRDPEAPPPPGPAAAPAPAKPVVVVPVQTAPPAAAQPQPQQQAPRGPEVEL